MFCFNVCLCLAQYDAAALGQSLSEEKGATIKALEKSLSEEQATVGSLTADKATLEASLQAESEAKAALQVELTEAKVHE